MCFGFIPGTQTFAIFPYSAPSARYKLDGFERHCTAMYDNLIVVKTMHTNTEKLKFIRAHTHTANRVNRLRITQIMSWNHSCPFRGKALIRAPTSLSCNFLWAGVVFASSMMVRWLALLMTILTNISIWSWHFAILNSLEGFSGFAPHTNSGGWFWGWREYTYTVDKTASMYYLAAYHDIWS